MTRLIPTLLLMANVVPGLALAFDVKLYNAKSNKPVEDAVVTLHPTSGKAPLPEKPEQKVMDQVNKKYVPHVLPVVVGTPVSFPNSDQIRHHVYSLDEIKSFELPLYKGTPPEPIVFDVPGAVSLGCNIHDHMSAHIYVVDTPWYAKSNGQGLATVSDVPDGEYILDVWHPRLKGRSSYRQVVTVETGSESAAEVGLNIRRVIKKKARVRSRDGGY